MCFDETEPKKCRRFTTCDDEYCIIDDVVDSKDRRNSISIGIYEKEPIAVGGWYNSNTDRMALNDDSYTWSLINDEFPCNGNVCANLYWYASVSTPNAYIIMGGKTGDDIRDEIVKFSDNKWGRDYVFSQIVFRIIKIKTNESK